MAREATRWAAQLAPRDDQDRRATHVGYYLVGAGAEAFRKGAGCRRSFSTWLRNLIERAPSFFYIGGIALLTALLTAGFERIVGASPLWLIVLLVLPVSQAALEIVNALVSRLLQPRSLPSMDFSDGVPADCKTMVVIPTLLLSAQNAARLLEDLEIRYLANRGANLYFGLLTDYADAAEPETANDPVLDVCIDGIRRLNVRYGAGRPGPFYLFHRPRRWNESEGRWMGHERKRGKLSDFNKLLLGRGNWFEMIVGDMSVLLEIRYVITLDTDTQLPRDSAAKMVAAIAHPLNRPLIDPDTRIVRQGYALIQPRVAVSMESAGRSWLAQIFSGQTGFDPYTTAVSDVYQDLYGVASFTGKGIYDVWAFEEAVGDRFPENTILSHDLIEGEHARTGLLTSVEVIDDYPGNYRAFCKRKHRWVRGDWQIMPWLFSRVPAPRRARVKNPLPFLSRWKIFDNLRRSLFEISVLLLLAAGWLFAAHTVRWTMAVAALLLLPAYVDMLLTVLRTPERRFWPSFLRSLGERFVKSHRDALLTLVFIPHQAFLMADAIVRTLVRFVTKRNRLEWQTMAQSEGLGGGKIDMVDRYLYFSAGACLLFLLALRANVIMALVCEFWIVAPLIAAWLDTRPPGPKELSERDRLFLRDVALRTWRYFADHLTHEDHWLTPDNVQEDPPLTAHRTSPTNLGLLVTSHLAAHDFGYWNLAELSRSLRRAFASLRDLPREHGHFYNWYDTRTLQPVPPRFLSAVDSGNLAASLCATGQGCLLLLRQPVFDAGILLGLRDHALRLRDELPYTARTLARMRLFASLLRQLDCQPNNLFYWEAVLIDARDTIERIHETLGGVHDRLRRQRDYERSGELMYWEILLSERMDAALAELYALAPWLTPSLEPELRVNITDTRLAGLFAELNAVPVLADLPDTYERIRQRLMERLESPEPLYP
ncbi:MAG: glycosyltransferase family 2 protein, partial [Bryobacteraceae bacterium]